MSDAGQPVAGGAATGTRRIAILSSASSGGAGIAARRICTALAAVPGMAPDFVDIRSVGGTLPATACLPGSASARRETDTHYTGEYPGYVRGWMVDLLSGYDIVNVHWASFLVSTAELVALARKGRPLLVTMHDHYYTTGGCHYPAGCSGQLDGCVGCPQVQVERFSREMVMAAYRDKQHLFSHPNVHISAPSRHIVDSAIACGMVPPSRAHVIRNIFEPVLAPGRLDTPGRNRNVLLIAASLDERRKGTLLALSALTEAAKHVPGMVVHLVGQIDAKVLQMFREAGLQVVAHGRIAEERRLAEIYRQVGVILTCSLEDNWPNVLVEGGAYGVVPVVGAGHGCEEFCRTFDIGEVARQYTPQAFAEAIRRCIDNYPAASRLASYVEAVRASCSLETVMASYRRTYAALEAGAPSHEDEPRPAASVVSGNYLAAFRRVRDLAGAVPVADGPFSATSHAGTGYGYPLFEIPDGARGV